MSNYRPMALQSIKVSSFFQKASSHSLDLFHNSDILLEASFSQNPQGPFKQKIALSSQFLAIWQAKNQGEDPSLLLPLTSAIKFQKMFVASEANSKTPVFFGISFSNDKQQSTRIYLQYSALLDLWLLKLSLLLNRLGFHQEFKLLERIGTGSTSAVHRVQRISDGKMMAAKVFLRSFLQSKFRRSEAALNEISLLRAMEHHNILKMHAAYETKNAIYLITDLLEGGNLLERINACKGLTPREIKQVMLGVAEGLAHMHGMGVMHRDIKLENIMFASKDSFQPVIVDLGLAEVSEEEPYIFYRCGTPGYIAPEIIGMEGEQPINVGCDVFSLGVIFHVLLTNRFLFSGSDNQEVYRSNKALSFDLSSENYKGCDPKAMSLMKAMLEIQEESRITAEEMLLHEYFDDAEWSHRGEQLVSPAATQSGEEQFIF